MDLTSFAFIAIIVLVVGPVIAYTADNLGRTLGKKRLRLGRLRPRHTATLFTVLAGAVIPLITVLIVAAVSADVRKWIAEGRQAIQQRDEALQQRNEARLDVERLTSEQASLQTRNQALASENLTRQQRLTKIQAQVGEQTRRLKTYEESIRRTTAEVGRLLASLKGVEDRLDTSESRLVLSQKDLKVVQSARDSVALSFRTLKRDQELLNEYNRKLDMENVELEKNLRTLASEKEGMETRIVAIQRDLRDNEQRLELTKINLDEAKGQLDMASTRLALMQGVLGANIDVSRFQPMIYTIGSELVRIPVPAGSPKERAEAMLSSVITAASTQAERLGAKPQPNSGAAGLVERKDDKGRRITPAEQRNMIVKGITGNQGDLVLVAYSALNAFKGEFVALDVRAFRNPLVYKQGQTIAEARVNGGASEDQILEQITSFLKSTVREQAIKDRMLPVAGGSQQFGEVDSEDILQLVKTIRSHDRPVRLLALAGADTRAADPLNLQFRVR